MTPREQLESIAFQASDTGPLPRVIIGDDTLTIKADMPKHPGKRKKKGK